MHYRLSNSPFHVCLHVTYAITSQFNKSKTNVPNPDGFYCIEEIKLKNRVRPLGCVIFC